MKPLPPLVVRAVPIHLFTRLRNMARVSMASLACCRSPGPASMKYWWLSPCHGRMCYLVFCCRFCFAGLAAQLRFETFSHLIRDDATKTQDASSKERIPIYFFRNNLSFKPVFAKESGCSWLQQGASRPIRKEIEVLLRKLARLHMAGRLIPVEQNKVNWMFHNLKYSKWTVTTNSLTELESKAKRKRHARLILLRELLIMGYGVVKHAWEEGCDCSITSVQTRVQHASQSKQ